MARGITVDGQTLVAVCWWPEREGFLDPVREPRRPAGYYFEIGNIVSTRLLEEAEEPTPAGWDRMREIAFGAYAEWLADPERQAEHQARQKGRSAQWN